MKTLLIRGTEPPPAAVREIINAGSTEVTEVNEGNEATGFADRVVEWTGRELLIGDRCLRWPDDEDELRMYFETGG
jgi:hypothetical protein